MGVRSNTGNIITNATQIGSVAATTASGLVKGLADASKALRNKKQQEYEKSLKPSTYAVAETPEEAEAVGKAEYEKRKAKALKLKEDEIETDVVKSVDEIISGDISPQSKNLSDSIKENISWQDRWYATEEEVQNLVDKGEI